MDYLAEAKNSSPELQLYTNIASLLNGSWGGVKKTKPKKTPNPEPQMHTEVISDIWECWVTWKGELLCLVN